MVETDELVRFWAGDGRYELRQLAASDARPLFELIDRNREHLSQHGDDTARKYPTYESVLSSITDPPDPSRLRLGIWMGAHLCGTINCTPTPEPGTRSVGYWIGEEYCRRGIATEALKNLVLYAFVEIGCTKLIARVHEEKFPSQLVLHRAGFRITAKDGDSFVFVCT